MGIEAAGVGVVGFFIWGQSIQAAENDMEADR